MKRACKATTSRLARHSGQRQGGSISRASKAVTRATAASCRRGNSHARIHHHLSGNLATRVAKSNNATALASATGKTAMVHPDKQRKLLAYAIDVSGRQCLTPGHDISLKPLDLAGGQTQAELGAPPGNVLDTHGPFVIDQIIDFGSSQAATKIFAQCIGAVCICQKLQA